MNLSPDLKALLDTALDQRARQMVRMRAQGQTLAQIAAHFGLTRQRVHQILRTRPTSPAPKDQALGA